MPVYVLESESGVSMPVYVLICITWPPTFLTLSGDDKQDSTSQFQAEGSDPARIQPVASGRGAPLNTSHPGRWTIEDYLSMLPGMQRCRRHVRSACQNSGHDCMLRDGLCIDSRIVSVPLMGCHCCCSHPVHCIPLPTVLSIP